MKKLLKFLRAARRKLDEYFPPTKTKYFVHRFYDNSGLMLEIVAFTIVKYRQIPRHYVIQKYELRLVSI